MVNCNIKIVKDDANEKIKLIAVTIPFLTIFSLNVFAMDLNKK